MQKGPVMRKQLSCLDISSQQKNHQNSALLVLYAEYPHAQVLVTLDQGQRSQHLACPCYKIRTVQWIQFKITTIIDSIMYKNWLDFEQSLH